MALRRLLPLVIPSTGPHTASLIFAHGFGDTSQGWAFLSSLPRLSHIKFIFPQAPLRPITIARGELIPAWFDIISQDHNARRQDGDEDERGMKESQELIDELVEEEAQEGIARERIVVGGFSQGAALALLCAVRGKKLGGVVVLSGYLPLQWKLLAVASFSSRKKYLADAGEYLQTKGQTTDSTPVFWAHGTSDQVIAYKTGVDAFERSRDSGMKEIEFHTYQGMQHEASDEELGDLEDWLFKRLPPIPVDAKL